MATSTANDEQITRSLMEAWNRYRQVRIELLKTLNLAISNRDPFAEFSEKLVLTVVGGTLDIDQSLIDHGPASNTVGSPSRVL